MSRQEENDEKAFCILFLLLPLKEGVLYAFILCVVYVQKVHISFINSLFYFMSFSMWSLFSLLIYQILLNIKQKNVSMYGNGNFRFAHAFDKIAQC